VERAGPRITTQQKRSKISGAKYCGPILPLEFSFVLGTPPTRKIFDSRSCARIHQTKLPTRLSRGMVSADSSDVSPLCELGHSLLDGGRSSQMCAMGELHKPKVCLVPWCHLMKRFWAASYPCHEMESKSFWVTASEGFWRPSIPRHVLHGVYAHHRDEYIIHKYAEKRWSALPVLPDVLSDKAYRIEERTVVQLLRAGMTLIDTHGLLCRFEASLNRSHKGHKSPERLASKRRQKENKIQTSGDDKSPGLQTKDMRCPTHARTLSKLTHHPSRWEPVVVFLNQQ
jgi:hypothetical protein